ncbi:MAG: hypothetical protein WKF91_22865 [Segetibacter sp.]
MKYKFLKDLPLLFCIATLLFSSCTKEGEQLRGLIVTSPPVTPALSGVSQPPCGNRSVINAKLVPIGSLSEARIGLVSAAAGNKILFAGGMAVGLYSSRVDIYDVTTNKWSTAELTKPERQAMAVASVGNKILFAGGGDNDMGGTTSRVDIYDASTNTWSVAKLSKGRESLAAVTLGNKVFFAGGLTWETSATGYSTWANSNAVDIYDNSTNTWSTAFLSDSRSDISATVVGNNVFFAGGQYKFYNGSSVIDIYDADNNSWSTSNLQKAKGSMASIAVSNKIFLAGGVSSINNFSGEVEIRDVNTGVSSFTCMIPRFMFNAVKKGFY